MVILKMVPRVAKVVVASDVGSAMVGITLVSYCFAFTVQPNSDFEAK